MANTVFMKLGSRLTAAPKLCCLSIFLGSSGYSALLTIIKCANQATAIVLEILSDAKRTLSVNTKQQDLLKHTIMINIIILIHQPVD